MPHCVIDGDPAPPPCERGTAVRPPLFDPCLLWLWATVATIDMGQEARGAGGRHGRLSQLLLSLYKRSPNNHDLFWFRQQLNYATSLFMRTSDV